MAEKLPPLNPEILLQLGSAIYFNSFTRLIKYSQIQSLPAWKKVRKDGIHLHNRIIITPGEDESDYSPRWVAGSNLWIAMGLNGMVFIYSGWSSSGKGGKMEG